MTNNTEQPSEPQPPTNSRATTHAPNLSTADHCTAPRSVLIVNGGPPPDPRVASFLPATAYVIAVDRGFEHATALDLPVHELLGDFDSLSASQLSNARARGIVIDQHPTAKDATDLELALARAVTLDAAHVTVLGGNGWEDRFDHIAGQLGLFASPLFAALTLTIWLGGTRVQPVHSAAEIRVPPGQLVSLIAIGGPVTGVTTTGLQYPLSGETLSPFTTRSVSNVSTRTTFSVTVASGVLLAILPDLLDSESVSGVSRAASASVSSPASSTSATASAPTSATKDPS